MRDLPCLAAGERDLEELRRTAARAAERDRSIVRRPRRLAVMIAARELNHA
jgi:hypothetical protein